MGEDKPPSPSPGDLPVLLLAASPVDLTGDLTGDLTSTAAHSSSSSTALPPDIRPPRKPLATVLAFEGARRNVGLTGVADGPGFVRFEVGRDVFSGISFAEEFLLRPEKSCLMLLSIPFFSSFLTCEHMITRPHAKPQMRIRQKNVH
jgi:hypothetical protein